MSGPRASILPVLLASLVLGCGGCAHTLAVGSDRTVQIALTEYRISPQSISVSAGSLTIRVHNFGRLTHNLVISENGQRTAATKDLWPGQDDAITLTLPPGTYRLSSTILSDEALGEFGTLRVSR